MEKLRRAWTAFMAMPVIVKACFLVILISFLMMVNAYAGDVYEGCLVLTPEQVEQMKSDFVEMLNEAFRLGQADQKERCASLI
jgi:hypothetical protein